jgi:hypothetical protein
MVWLYRSPFPSGEEGGNCLAQIISTCPTLRLEEGEGDSAPCGLDTLIIAGQPSRQPAVLRRHLQAHPQAANHWPPPPAAPSPGASQTRTWLHSSGRTRSLRQLANPPGKTSYLWTYNLYGPVRNALDAGKSIARASGRGGGSLCNDIEPSGHG